jgi:predicted NUDIX family NTP pyrophosphohydrolase
MRTSAGIVLYRSTGGSIEVLLGHMGGPYWAGKDAGAWTIPKGEYEPDEDPLAAARREFDEEVGVPVPATGFVDLGEIRQSGGKVVRAWAAPLDDLADFDPSQAVGNTFEIEWPPRSGRTQTFPELDRIAWFGLESAREMIIAGQRELLDRLASRLGHTEP